MPSTFPKCKACGERTKGHFGPVGLGRCKTSRVKSPTLQVTAKPIQTISSKKYSTISTHFTSQSNLVTNANKNSAEKEGDEKEDSNVDFVVRSIGHLTPNLRRSCDEVVRSIRHLTPNLRPSRRSAVKVSSIKWKTCLVTWLSGAKRHSHVSSGATCHSHVSSGATCHSHVSSGATCHSHVSSGATCHSHVSSGATCHSLLHSPSHVKLGPAGKSVLKKTQRDSGLFHISMMKSNWTGRYIGDKKRKKKKGKK